MDNLSKRIMTHACYYNTWLYHIDRPFRCWPSIAKIYMYMNMNSSISFIFLLIQKFFNMFQCKQIISIFHWYKLHFAYILFFPFKFIYTCYYLINLYIIYLLYIFLYIYNLIFHFFLFTLTIFFIHKIKF